MAKACITETTCEFNPSPDINPSLIDKKWRSLSNFEKERVQMAYINQIVQAEAEKHPDIAVFVHFRTKERRTTDADIILVKDGKVKDQIELGHLWYGSFKNVSYALNPRRQALLKCPSVEISESFKSWYIQNGGRYDPYLRKACSGHNWNLIRLPLIHHMTRKHRRLLEKVIHQIFIHTISEQQHVYDKTSVASCNVSVSTSSGVCGVLVEGDYAYYSFYFASVGASSRRFDPLEGLESQHLPIEAVKMWDAWQQYISLAYPLDASTRRWLNELDVYAQMTREEWLQP